MKKKFLGRVLTMLLVASMVFTLLPAPAIAAGNWWWNNEAYTEEAVPTATADNSNFMRIFHLDCGRKYFSVTEIKGIIDQLAANNYTHIELAFGNEGLRFVPDASRMAVGEYEGDKVVAAIAEGHKKYDNDQSLNYTVDSWTESDMDLIFAHAAEKGIKIIPMLDIPGHMNAVIYAMQELKINVSMFSQVGTKYPGNIGRSFDTTNTDARNFAKGLVDNYIKYFAEKKCKYFNIAGDECGFVKMTAQQYDAYIGLMNELNTSIKSAGMTTMMFNDGVYYKGNNVSGYTQKFDTDIVICYWTGGDNYSTSTALAKLGFRLINTNVHWYYVAGNDYNYSSSVLFGYDYAISSMQTRKCTECDGGGATADTGCMLAYWCDNPTASVDTTKLNTYIKTLADNNPDYFKTTATPDKPGTKLEEREITVTVGGTDTDTIDGNYQDTYEPKPAGIATVETTIKAAGTEGVKVGDKIAVNNKNLPATVTGVISDGNGNYMMVSGNTIENTKEVSKATQFTVTRRQNGTNGFKYEINSGDKYLMISSNGVAISSSYYDNNRYDNDNGFYYYGMYSDYYLYYNAYGSWSSHYSMGNGFLYATVEEGASEKTLVTFNGIAEGDTYVTIGNVHYTIHVTEEDLSKAKALPIQLWITSQTIAVDQDGMKSKQTSGYFGNRKPQYLEISATDKLNTPEGRPLSECVPELIEKHYENDGTWWTTELSNKQPFDFMLWKGTVLKSGSIQTVWGTSCINKGTDFAYVRYLGGKWEVSNDRSKWTTVTGDGSTSSSDSCEEQLVAYYYMQTKLTEDVTTNIVDWGEPYESKSATDYVLLDFAVKTETGEATPAISSFPMEKRTLYYHCNGNADTCGTDSNNYKYRRIDQIEARNTGAYEIYMITLTPTADSAATKLASTCNENAAGSGIYKGTEKVVWVKDADTLQKTEFADENLWYTSPSGKTFDSADTTGEYVGGKAELSNVEIYNKQGLLVTYYVRSTAVHKVYVHYIDNKTNTPFHTVEISVPTGTTYFDPNFGMASGKLINNIVAGVNHPETVQSDLQQLPLVPAQYRRANYTLTDANLGGNTSEAKDAYLYYDFSNAESFVVDFGLPLTITPKDVGNLGTATITNTKISYNGGLADISATTNGTITYKLNKPLGKTPDSFSVTYTGPSLSGTETKGDVDVTFTIYIYPASNVLYEENFLTEAPASNGLSWKEGTSTAPTTPQQTQKAKADGNVFGYDDAYVSNGTKPVTGELGAWTATGLEVNKRTTSALTTDFYGNGFDLIGNCGPTTGRVIMVISNEDGTGKLVDVDTRYAHGDLYQVPLAHVVLPEGKHTASIYAAGLAATTASATGYNLSGAATYASDYVVGGYDTVLSDILAENGLTMADVEYVKVESAPAATTRSATSFYALDTAAVGGTVTHGVGTHVEIGGFRVYRSTDNASYPTNEQNLKYVNVLDAVTFNNDKVAYTELNGAHKLVSREDYESNGGPQNEIYLMKDQSVVFNLGSDMAGKTVQITARAVTGTAAMLNTTPISSNTEMYYEVTVGESGTLAIQNSGEGMLAIANLKVPNTVTFNAVTAETLAIAERMLLAYAGASGEGDAFDPAISAKVTTTRFIRSKVVTLTVSASADVAVLEVNGVELRPTNSWLVKMGWSDTYTYILTEKVPKNEIKTYEIVGYRADGAASETIVVKSK